MGKNLVRVFALLCAVNLIGCSCFVPWEKEFFVRGIPNDATVHVIGEEMQIGGGSYFLRRDRGYKVVVSKEGYETENFCVNSTLGTCGALDVLGGCVWIVPFVGLAFPGAYTLDRDHYYFNLKPIK